VVASNGVVELVVGGTSAADISTLLEVGAITDCDGVASLVGATSTGPLIGGDVETTAEVEVVIGAEISDEGDTTMVGDESATFDSDDDNGNDVGVKGVGAATLRRPPVVGMGSNSSANISAAVLGLRDRFSVLVDDDDLFGDSTMGSRPPNFGDD
jgi:hypothetical protein